MTDICMYRATDLRFGGHTQSVHFFVRHQSGMIAHISQQHGCNLYHFSIVISKAFEMLADCLPKQTPVFFRTSYRDKDKDSFLRYFGLGSWGKLTQEEQALHTFQDCNVCSTEHRKRYIKLRRNALGLFKFGDEGDQPTAPPPKPMSDQEKQELIRRTIEKIGGTSVAATNRAVLAHDVSYRKLQNIRRGITLERKECARPKYIPKLDKYVFDVESVCNTIADCTQRGTKINWARLARDNPVFISDT